MAVDRYTKFVLTLIAVCLVCLVWLSAGGASLITPVHAQAESTRVLISGWVDGDGNVRRIYPNATGSQSFPVSIANK